MEPKGGRGRQQSVGGGDVGAVGGVATTATFEAASRVAVILAVVGAVLVAVGVGLVYVPAGVIVAGVELIAAAYVHRYLEANR